MVFKFLLYLFLFYVVFKIFKWFFRPSAAKRNADPHVRTSVDKQESIKQEDIIEASFEEIKIDDK